MVHLTLGDSKDLNFAILNNIPQAFFGNSFSNSWRSTDGSKITDRVYTVRKKVNKKIERVLYDSAAHRGWLVFPSCRLSFSSAQRDDLISPPHLLFPPLSQAILPTFLSF